MKELILVFTGICAFVGKSGEPPSQVLLPRSESPAPAHHAYVLIDKSLYATGQNRPHDAETEDHKSWIFLLDGEELSLKPALTEPTPPKRSANFDAYVADMAKAVDFPAVDPVLLSHPPSSRIVAHIAFTAGQFDTGTPSSCEWIFKPKRKLGKTYQTQLAQEVKVVLTAKDGEIVLQSKPLPGATDRGDLRLTPTGAWPVTIEIGNVLAGEETKVGASTPHTTDDHFAIHCSVLKNPKSCAVPTCLTKKPFANRHGSNCPPAVFPSP
jgi:hypothetical protein